MMIGFITTKDYHFSVNGTHYAKDQSRPKDLDQVPRLHFRPIGC